eukprot:2469535-Rhodomonas_salina.1
MGFKVFFGMSTSALTAKAPTDSVSKSILSQPIIFCREKFSQGCIKQAYEMSQSIKNSHAAAFAQHEKLMRQIHDKYHVCMDLEQKMSCVEMADCVRVSGSLAAFTVHPGQCRPTSREHKSAVLVEGIIDAPLFEVFLLMQEVALYKHWLPDVGDSYLIEGSTVSPFARCMWVLLQSTYPPLVSDRDACIQMDFYDCLEESATPSLMWVARDMENDSTPRISNPQTVRASVGELAVQFLQLRDRSVRVRVLCEMDTHNPIRKLMSQNVAHWIMAGHIFSALESMTQQASLLKQHWDKNMKILESLQLSRYKMAFEQDNALYERMKKRIYQQTDTIVC